MEDVLAVYTRPRDPDRPLVCLDETSKQLIAETRVPIPMKRGRPARYDYEYERNGTANLFMLFAPLEGWRHVKVTDRHTAVDYAPVLKELADIHFANAKTIVLVQDNLNIHSKASLYEAFPAAEARRLVERFEWHYTQSTAAGSIWRSPNSASYPANALTAACPINRPSSTKSPPGNTTEMSGTPRPTGTSQPPTPASSSSTCTLQSD
jgi:DDE superfamily endonuclease